MELNRKSLKINPNFPEPEFGCLSYYYPRYFGEGHAY